MKCRLAQCPSVYPGQISGGAVISAVSVGASGRKAASPIYGIALPVGIGRTGRHGRKCTLGGGMDEARHADVSLWRLWFEVARKAASKDSACAVPALLSKDAAQRLSAVLDTECLVKKEKDASQHLR